MATVGDPIHLDFQLHDFSTDKFVKAKITADGVEIPLSPINVPHVGDGSHFFMDTSTLIFPAGVKEIAITYSVYRDVLLTDRIKCYGVGRDSYRLSNAGNSIEDSINDSINKIIDIVSSHDLNSQLVGFVEEDYIISGEVIIDEVVGYVTPL
jgi:hypothetical protein